MDGFPAASKPRHGRLLRSIALIVASAMLIWILSSSLNWMPNGQQAASVRPEEKAVQALLKRTQPTVGFAARPSGQPAVSPKSDPMQKLAEAYAKARTEISRGRYEPALAWIDECLRLDDAANRELTLDLWLKKGALHAMLGDPEKALTGIDRALAMAPETEEAWLAKSQIQAGEKQYLPAIDSLGEYLRLKPEETRLHANMAELRYNVGQYAAAVAECSTYLDLCDSKDAAIRFLRGSSLVRLEAYGEACDDFLAAKEFGHDNAECLSQAAYCRLMLKDYAAAAQLCTNYLEQCDANSGAIHVLRASCQVQLGSYQAAAEDYAAAVSLGYEQAECSEQAAYCHLMLKNYASALQFGERALQLGRAKDTLYQQLGVAALGLEKSEQAAAYFTKSIEINPELAMNHYYRGVCQMSLKKYADAKADFSHSLEKGDMVQVCYYNRGICQIYLKQYNGAKSDMQQAIRTGSDKALAKSASDVLGQLAQS